MNYFDISTAQSYSIIKIIFNEFAIFINLNQYCFFESFDVVLHEFKNVDYNVNNIFSFCDEQSLLNEIICNII